MSGLLRILALTISHFELTEDGILLRLLDGENSQLNRESQGIPAGGMHPANAAKCNSKYQLPSMSLRLSHMRGEGSSQLGFTQWILSDFVQM